MEPIIYKPYTGYRITSWALIVFIFVGFLISHFIILPTLVLLPFIILLRLLSRVTLILDDNGIDLRHEFNGKDRFVPWDQLPYYRLDNNTRGTEVILLSPTPINPKVARRFAFRSSFSTRIWYNGVMVIPLSFWGNTDSIRNFIYQKTLHK